MATYAVYLTLTEQLTASGARPTAGSVGIKLHRHGELISGVAVSFLD